MIKMKKLIFLLQKAKTTTWIAFVGHLFLFSALTHSAIQKFGFHWSYILIPVVIPTYVFFKNIQDYDLQQDGGKI